MRDEIEIFKSEPENKIIRKMLENQMRKLSLENCTLQLENKLLKDKHSRAVAQISDLEAKLREVQNDIYDLQKKLDDESSRLKLTLKAEMEREIEQYKARAATSAKEVEILKSEISFLEEQLGTVRQEYETIRHGMDKSKIYDAHKQEIQTFQDETAHLKHLLKQTEHALETESTKCRDLIGQVHKLTEIQEVFQLQFQESNSEGSAAEKQIASLQMRLRVTEERLTLERADRAGNLSQIEEKLLSENAKLQIKSAELDRQLKKEKEKARTLDHRANELREENLQLRLAVPSEDNKDYSIPNNRHWQNKISQKPAYDVKQILELIESKGTLSATQEDVGSLVLYLWSRCQELQQKMKEWQLYLEQLELPSGEDFSVSLQGALAVKTEYEAKMQQTEDKFEDISAEKITAEQTYKQQLSSLVKERHEAFARLKTLEDLMAALRAENETLRQGLTMTPGHLMVRSRERETGESGQVEVLCTEIASLKSNIGQLIRRNKVLVSELNTLQCQLTSRDKELTETFAELKSVQMAPRSSMSDDQLKQQRIQSLTSEIATLKEELRLQKEQHSSDQIERHRLEVELSEVKDELRSVKQRNREQDLSSSLTQKNHAEKLEAELEKKDEEILKLINKLNENEASLLMAQSELTLQQKTHQNMEAQLKSIQQQLDQRCEVLDALSAKENDQLEQLELVKGMVHTLNQAVSHKQGELEVLQLELKQANAKIAELEEQNAELTIIIEDRINPGEIITRCNPLAADLRIGEMKVENEELETQMMQTASELTSLRQDCEVLTAEVSKVKQEASNATVTSIKTANENAILERRVKTLEEERTVVKEERDVCKEDINRLETSLHEVVSKFEDEAKVKLTGFSTEYRDSSDGQQKLNDELRSLHIMVFAKEKENSAVMDKVKRQEQELMNYERMYKLLCVENEQDRQDVTRISNELVLKVRESTATLELNRMLLKEQASLQKQLVHVEAQLEWEKKRNEQRKAEISGIIKKIEHSDQVTLATSLTLQQKDSVISDQEVRLKQLGHDLNQSVVERDNLKTKIDELTESLRSLSNVNSGLEHKIEAKEAEIHDEQTVVSKQKEEIVTLFHRLEVFKHEQTLMLNNLGTERKVQEKLQEDIKASEECKQQLNKRLTELTGEFEIQKGHLVAAREIIQQMKEEKEVIMKDYQAACRRLGEKETVLQEMHKKKYEEITKIKEETLKQSHAVTLEKVNAERDLGQLKQEIESLKNQLQRKEDQVSSFGQIVTELEDAKRQILNLESYTSEQNKIAAETKILVESLRNELFTVRDQNAKLHDTVARKEVSIIDLKDQLRHCGESSENKVIELKHTIEGMRSHHEYEKKSLREFHSKVEENLNSSKQEIQTLKDALDHVTEQAHHQERLLQEANHKTTQEEGARRWAEERLSQLQGTIEDLSRKKTALEENVNRLQISLNKSEAECSVMKERTKSLASQMKNLQMALTVSEEALKERDEKTEKLKADIIRYQQMLEDHRQQSTKTVRKLDLDLKQQVQSQEKDQMKLNQQAHQLSVDLEQAREVIVFKNKENLKLQERVLELENHLREGETRLKHTEKSLKQEEEMQSRLINRFEEQESELKKLRTFLAKKADEDGDGKGMWQEMNHILSELSNQLHFHIETSRLLGQGGQDDTELVHRLRRSLLEAESQLNTERALHAVTRSSMQALEEDCLRLRQTISAMRRRGIKSEKKQKSRMEEINEIIARSQTRAQALLASGEFSLDASLRSLTPSRDYSLGDANFSPDTSFASDTSFSGAHMANLSFLNLSGNLGTFSPRK